MIKKNKWTLVITSLVIILPIVFGLLAWNRLPEQIATHWGIDGNADGWSSRPAAVFSMPLFILAVHWLCLFCTYKDPRHKNQSSKVFNMVLWICPLISLAANSMIYASALGSGMKPYLIASLMMGFIYIIIGNYLPKCRQNSTIGVRVKWALENEENWNKTHRFCGKTWVIGGFIILACAFLPETISAKVLIVMVVVLSMLPIGYSYCYSRMQKKEAF